MAEISSVATVIASALNEIGVNGTVHVEMDGKEAVETVGVMDAEEVEIVVTVRPVVT